MNWPPPVPPPPRSRPDTRVGYWWLAIITLSWFGGLIGYLATRSTNPARANRIMVHGLLSLLWLWFAWAMFFAFMSGLLEGFSG